MVAAENQRTAHLQKVAGLATSNRLFTQAGITRSKRPRTGPGSFTTAAGKRVTVPMLTSQDADPSASADGWQSVQLPNAHGQLTAYALLPPATGKACAVPDPATFTALLHPAAENVATVAMPQFHLTQTNELLNVLTDAGLQPGGN